MVFVSHAFDPQGLRLYSALKDALDQEAERMRKAGRPLEPCEVWHGDIAAGQPLRQGIVDRLDASDAVVVLVPPPSSPGSPRDRGRLSKGTTLVGAPIANAGPTADSHSADTDRNPTHPWLVSEYFRVSGSGRLVIPVFSRVDGPGAHTARDPFRDLLTEEVRHVEVDDYTDAGITAKAEDILDAIVAYQHLLRERTGELEDGAGEAPVPAKRIRTEHWVTGLATVVLLAIGVFGCLKMDPGAYAAEIAQRGPRFVVDLMHLPALAFFVYSLGSAFEHWKREGEDKSSLWFIDDTRIRRATQDCTQLMFWVLLASSSRGRCRRELGARRHASIRLVVVLRRRKALLDREPRHRPAHVLRLDSRGKQAGKCLHAHQRTLGTSHLGLRGPAVG